MTPILSDPFQILTMALLKKMNVCFSILLVSSAVIIPSGSASWEAFTPLPRPVSDRYVLGVSSGSSGTGCKGGGPLPV